MSGTGLVEENAALRRLLAAYQHLSGLASQEVAIGTVAELIAERVGTAVAVVDDRLGLLAAAAPGKAAPSFHDWISQARLIQVLGSVGPTSRAVRVPGPGPVIVAPIQVGDTVAAYLLTHDDGADDIELRILLAQHAATICGVILGRERVVAAAATRARSDLVAALLSGTSGDAEEMRRWAAHLGYEEGRSHRAICLALDGADEPVGRAASAAQRFFTTRIPAAVIAVRGHEVVAVVPGPDALSLAAACVEGLAGRFPGVVATAGVGANCTSSADIAASCADARRTVEIAGRMGRAGTAVAVDDLGIHQLLLQVADPAQLRGFAHDVFGGLLANARNNAKEYLATLACYFRGNNSPQRASQELHVHPNTVSYRVRRIEELTDLDFRNYRDRLMAQVALEILDVVGD